MASAPIRLARSTICLLSRKPLTGPGPDQIGLVRLLDINPGRIGFGIDRGRGDIQFAAGADDPHGNFAAIGDQNFAEHVCLVRMPGEFRSGVGLKKDRVT